MQIKGIVGTSECDRNRSVALCCDLCNRAMGAKVGDLLPRFAAIGGFVQFAIICAPVENLAHVRAYAYSFGGSQGGSG